jgi:hypothetical protein
MLIARTMAGLCSDTCRRLPVSGFIEDFWPLCSPDGASFYFADYAVFRVMKMAIDTHAQDQ